MKANPVKKSRGSVKKPTLKIGVHDVAPGQRSKLELPIARLATQSMLYLPVDVVHGLRPGPTLWLSAAVHGDELNGVEIIRQVQEKLDPSTLRGTVISVPIVNVFGFINESRYLPDRRDLNRSFPGSAKGSLAARTAHLFMTEIVAHCTHGIDIHTAGSHKRNLPQIRANLKDPETLEMALAFAAPVALNAQLRDGSLREAASRRGIPILVYEAGEPQRFNRVAVQAGVSGVLRVMKALNMGRWKTSRAPAPVSTADNSVWIRARRSGLFRASIRLGETVAIGQEVGVIADTFGDKQVRVTASTSGMVVGITLNPLLNQGDAILHIAKMDGSD